MKHVKYLFALLIMVMVLAGCQKVSDTRLEFCNSLREVGTLSVEFKEAKVDQPVDEFRTKVESLQQRRQNLERLARITSFEGLDRLVAAIDTLAAAVAEVSGSTLGPAVERINAAGAALETVYLDLNDAFCSEK